jgi:hypothetical protein
VGLLDGFNQLVGNAARGVEQMGTNLAGNATNSVSALHRLLQPPEGNPRLEAGYNIGRASGFGPSDSSEPLSAPITQQQAMQASAQQPLGLPPMTYSARSGGPMPSVANDQRAPFLDANGNPITQPNLRRILGN